MEEKKLRTQTTVAIADFDDAKLRRFRATTRRFAAWNRRAVLLRALDANPDAADRAMLESDIAHLQNAFQDAEWERAGDAAAGLDPITPMPSKTELADLAEANKAVAQQVASAAFVADFFRLGTKFLNIANGSVPS